MKIKKGLILFCLSFLISVAVPARLSWATFAIDIDVNQIDFGLMNVGEQKSDIPGRGVIITCFSDQGNLWKLNVYAERPFTHEFNSTSFIANSDFYWYGVSTNGSGILKKIAEDFTFEKTVYTSSAGEGDPAVSIEVRFRLDVRKMIQSGRYTTRVIFTMFE